MKSSMRQCLKCGWVGHRSLLIDIESFGVKCKGCPKCLEQVVYLWEEEQMKTPMQIIRERQYSLERDLESKLADVDQLVSSFAKETGVAVSGIRIELMETTTFGSQPEYHMCGVMVEYGT
jgi:hypothetical protein